MKGKYISTYIVICLYFLFSGIEYAVILPTLNQYLETLDAGQLFIGLVMSSFSITGLLSAPIYGRFTDLTGSTKAAVMFSNVFEIAGNIMYFLAKDPWMVVGSRLVAGLGAGSGSSIFGAISRSTSEAERTSKFAQLMAVRQFGLLIGPACNVFLEKLDFYIGAVHVTSLSAPGLFMALLWTIHEILMVFLYHEFTSDTSSENGSVVSDKSIPYQSIGDHYQSSDEEVEISQPDDRSQEWSVILNDLLKEEIVVFLAVTFTIMFVQTGTETLLTPLTKQFFNWEEFLNSMFFVAAGGIIIISFFTLSWISKKVSDRKLLLSGFIALTLLYAGFLVYVIFAVQAAKGSTWILVVFCVYSFFLIFDLPFVWVPNASLFSKLTNDRSQAFNQGIRLVVMGLGQIIGPIWAASLLDRLPIMYAVNTALVAFVLVLIIASYKRLQVPNADQRIASTINDSQNENSPLLQT